MIRHRRSKAALVCVLTAMLACGKGSQAESAKRNASVLPAAEEPEDLVCEAAHDGSDQAFVIFHLDSAAADVDRVTINMVQLDTLARPPLRAVIRTSTGSTECSAKSNVLNVTVRGEQTTISLVVYSPSVYVAVNARRLGQRGEMLNARAFAVEDHDAELVWGRAAPGAMDNVRGEIRSTPPEPRSRTPQQPRGLP